MEIKEREFVRDHENSDYLLYELAGLSQFIVDQNEADFKPNTVEEVY